MAGPQSQRMHKTCHKAWNACLHTPHRETPMRINQVSRSPPSSRQLPHARARQALDLVSNAMWPASTTVITYYICWFSPVTSTWWPLSVSTSRQPLPVSTSTSSVTLPCFWSMPRLPRSGWMLSVTWTCPTSRDLSALIQAMDPVHSQALRLYAPPPTVHPLLAPLDAPLGLRLSVLSLRLRYTTIRAHFTLLQPCTPATVNQSLRHWPGRSVHPFSGLKLFLHFQSLLKAVIVGMDNWNWKFAIFTRGTLSVCMWHLFFS